jgi:hypothetical protein
MLQTQQQLHTINLEKNVSIAFFCAVQASDRLVKVQWFKGISKLLVLPKKWVSHPRVAREKS